MPDSFPYADWHCGFGISTSGKPVELLARHVKDLLADTGPQGTLARMIARRNTASLRLYAAFFDGFGRKIFPELRTAVAAFKTTGDWETIDSVRMVGYRRAQGVTEEMISIYKGGKQKPDASCSTAVMTFSV